MQPKAPRVPLARALIAVVLAFVTACSPEPPKPSASSSAPTTDATPPPKVVGDLALEACDPTLAMPCEPQAVFFAEPVAASGVALTYSTEWADGRLDRPLWNADALGLGGWSIDVMQRYDPERGILLSGDGSWRFAAAAAIGDGDWAVPSHDGLQYAVFDAAWRHVRTVDSISGATLLAFTFDDGGRLSQARGHNGGARVDLTIDRDPAGTIRALIGAAETRTGAAFDGNGRLAAVGRPDGTILTVTYVGFGLVADWFTTGRGLTRYQWDDSGRLALETDPDNVSRRLVYAAANGAVTVTTTDGNDGTRTFKAERIGEGVRRTLSDADGTVTQLETDAEGGTRMLEADGTVTVIGAVAHPRWGLAAPIRSPLVETRPDGTEYRVETTTTMATGSPEPAGGSWERVTVANGQRSVDAYDPASRTVTTTDAAGRRSTSTLDDLGRLTARTSPGEPAFAIAYDPSGFVSSRTVGEGPTAATTTFAYDAERGEIHATGPDGATATLRIDLYGRPRSASTTDENISFVQDPAGAPLQLRPGTHPATGFGYSEAGRQTAFIPPVVGDDGWYELTTYTAGGLPATISDPRGTRIAIEYDAAGRATTWTFDGGSSTAAYDARTGLLAATTSPDGIAASFEYAGWVPTGIAWSGPIGGEVRRTVNGLLQPVEETVNGSERLVFAYDPSGRLTSLGGLAITRHPQTGLAVRFALGDVATVYEYDAAGRMIAGTTTAAGSAIVAVRYTRDLRGRVTSVERTDGAGDVTTTTFSFDASGRLDRVERAGVATVHSYDASGNRRTTSRDGEVGTAATFDDRDRISSHGDVSFAWDPDGTLLERSDDDGTRRYDFNDLGALESVILADGRRVDYVLDAGGRRVGRMVDGVLTDGYLYSVEDAIVAWTDGSGRVRARFAYDDAGRLALVQRDGRDLLAVTDQVGSPIAIVDGETGAVVARAAYDAWGNPLDGSVSEYVPFGFAGGLTDDDTGLVHFGARDYDPATGRWTAPDPLRYLGGDINLYRYASGDPVNNVDPTGTSACRAGACSSTAAGASLARPAPVGGGKRGGTTGGAGTGGTRGGSATGYRDRGPTRHTQPPEPTWPASVIERSQNQGTLSQEHAIPEEYFPDEDTDPWQNCIGPNCRYVPGTNAGYCKGGDCIVRDPGGSYGWCTGWCIFGEPHLVTADAGRIDFQAAGEFVISRSPDGAFEIQGRFEVSPTVQTVTRTTAVAIRVGVDRVAFHADPARPIVVNGQPIDRAGYATTLPGGGVVERLGSDAVVLWPDGSRLGVHLHGKFMDFWFTPADAVRGTTVGILGSQDGNRANDLTTRAGNIIDPEAADFREQLYGAFADGWRISQEESLFDYMPGETTATFQRPEVPTEHVTVNDLEAATRSKAETLCRAMGVIADPILSDCILDVGMTGDPSYAASAAAVAAALEIANVPALDIGSAVARDQPVRGGLAAGGTNRYHFSASPGDIVYLDAEAACDPALSWRLLRPNGAISWFEDACTDIGRRVLSEAGEWIIEVYSDTSAAGAYDFRVRSVAAPIERPIAIGGSASGTTTAVGEWHRYTFQGAAGQVLYLDAEGGCESPLSWRLLAPGGVLTTFQTACTDIGRRVLSEAGAWVVEVYSDDLDVGAYAFRVIGVPAPTERPIALGGSASGTTTAVGEWHRYALDATAGQVVYLDAEASCDPDMSWRLLRPDGALSWFATTCTDIGRQVLTVAGTWVIEVYADDLDVGAYSFRVIEAPAVRVQSIAIGRRVSDEIDAIGEWHRYRLAADAGDRIVIDAGSGCVPELYWRLLRPDGTLTTFGTTCTDSDVRTLDVDGTWLIEVYSDTMVTGAYELTVEAAP